MATTRFEEELIGIRVYMGVCLEKLLDVETKYKISNLLERQLDADPNGSLPLAFYRIWRYFFRNYFYEKNIHRIIFIK